MKLEAVLVARLVVMIGLFPALAGCAVEAGEPLTRADVPTAGPPGSPPELAWASLDEATVRPGVVIHTERRDCNSNFLFVRPDNGAVFLGTTAYCVRDLPIGSVASLGADNDLALLVYNSIMTMEQVGEDDPAALEYNDFAVFHLDSATARKANPTALQAEGPTGLADGASIGAGDRVRAFSPWPELPRETNWRDGVVTGRAGDWALLSYHAPPGKPGLAGQSSLMGGSVLDPEGRAVGVLVTVGVVPNPGANGIARLDTLLAYAREHAGLIAELAGATA